MSPSEIKEQIVAINNAVDAGLHLEGWEQGFMESITFQFSVWEQAQIGVPLTPKQCARLEKIYSWIAAKTLADVKKRGAL